MHCCFTFDYLFQFLYLKNNARPTLKKKTQKITIFILTIFSFTLLYLFVLLLLVRQIILIFFIFIWQYSFPPKHTKQYRNRYSKTVIQTEP